jgi:hypothetical protein
MLFVAEYELTWPMLDAAVAKRIEWDDTKPDGFRFLGEYVWQDGEAPFRGFAVIEADSVEALNAFILHYGPTLKISIHPASDVVSAIRLLGAGDTSRLKSRRRPPSRRRVAVRPTSRPARKPRR